MLWAVTVAVAIFAKALPCAFGIELYYTKVIGVARPTEEKCLADLPQFKQKLKYLGLTFTKKPECVSIDEEAKAFVPSAETQSPTKKIAETAAATYQATEEKCKKVLGDLIAAVSDDDETVVESGCAPLSIYSSAGPKKTTLTYQPTAVLLKTGDFAVQTKTATAPESPESSESSDDTSDDSDNNEE